MQRLNFYLDEEVKNEKAILDYIGTSKKKTANIKYLLGIGLYAIQGGNYNPGTDIAIEETNLLSTTEEEELDDDELSDDIIL